MLKKHPFTLIHPSRVIKKLSDKTVNTKPEWMNQYSRQVRVQGDTLRETCSDVFGFHRNSERVRGLALFHDRSVFRPAQVLSKPSHLASSWPIKIEHKQTWRTMFSWPLCHRCLRIRTFKPHVYP